MSVFSVVSALVAISAKRLSPGGAIMFGGFASTAGMGFLVLSAAQRSLPIFLASIAAAGIGYSLTFLGGLNLINSKAPKQHRGGTLSAVLLVAYLMQGVIALLLGAIATARGLRLAIDLASAAIAMLSLIAIALAASRSSGLIPNPKPR